MKIEISNLRNVIRKEVKYFGHQYDATVDVTTTTGFWVFKKILVEEKQIFKQVGTYWWSFLDTGDSVPSDQINKLARVYFHKKGWVE